MDDDAKDEIQSEVIGQLTEMMDSFSTILETFSKAAVDDPTVEELKFIGGGMMTVIQAMNMWSETADELIHAVDASLHIAEKRAKDQTKFEEIVTNGLDALPVTDPYDAR